MEKRKWRRGNGEEKMKKRRVEKSRAEKRRTD